MTDDVQIPGLFEIKRRRDGHGTVLALQGELDLASAPELELHLDEIEARSPGRILLDLRSLNFMDCTGVSLIVRAQQTARANGHLLALRRGPYQVQRLFQLTGLLEHLKFLD
jgi:anti-sigma B factor antagonist